LFNFRGLKIRPHGVRTVLVHGQGGFAPKSDAESRWDPE
jgi:hypothetical protein